MTKSCVLCGHPSVLRSKYCPRCRPFMNNRVDATKRRKAMAKAYDSANDGFRCRYSGILLEEKDWHSPWYLTFDHRIPKKASDLVVTSRVINGMKTDLGPSEFRAIVKELARHWKGKAFDRGVAKFKYWYRARRRSGRPKARRRLLTPTPARYCAICGAPAPKYRKYCLRCHDRIGDRDKGLRAKALKRAWSARKQGYVCQYSGVKVDESDSHSPWYLTFDHPIPHDRKRLVASAHLFNSMKADLSDVEFRAFVKQLARKFNGGKFDKSAIKFRYWHRAARPKKRNRYA